MPAWKVTVRNRSEVSRRSFDRLDDALASARAEADDALATEPLTTVKAIRDYAPGKQIKARVEISGKGLLRPPTAGFDIHGDHSLIGYRGAVRRRPIGDGTLEGIFKAIEKVLSDD